MLLRRITEHVKAQNWTAVALDFLIVVVGVFMGLQVQEWDAARADRNAEQIVLERLIVEYEKNIAILADDKIKAERARAGTEVLLGMIAPELDPAITDEIVAKPLNDCLQNAKFIPALGVTNSLVASGDLRLIGDPEIQSMLTQWPATAQSMIEWQEIERNHGEELIFGLTTEFVAWPTIESLNQGTMDRSNLVSDYQGLFSSIRFAGLLTNRHHNTSTAIRRMDELSAETTVLIERLRTRLEELQRR
jgi:hypothetical protein